MPCCRTTFEGRRENLNQANKLSRTYTMQMDAALSRYRGKGQQKVTVEHVHVHAGGRPLSALSRPGVGWRAEIKGNPMQKPLPMPASRATLGRVSRICPSLGSTSEATESFLMLTLTI